MTKLEAALPETVIKRFELVEIPEEEPASCPSAP